MKIVFKNGKEIAITQEVADIIRDNIISGTKQWQLFSNESGQALLMVNLHEIAYINQ